VDRDFTRRDRVLAACAGDPVDRPPVSFWGHFYDREGSAKDLASATLEARNRYDWDFVKLNPRASYHGEPWGLSFRASTEPLVKPTRLSHPIHDLADYEKITTLPGDTGALGEQLEAIRLVKKGLPDDVLLVETVFSPLAVVTDMAENTQAVERHLAADEERVRSAVEAVTRTFEDFVPKALAAGADGIYLATVEWASRDRDWSPDGYRSFAMPYERRLLEKARGATFNVFHVCRPHSFVAALADTPVHALSWDSTAPGNPDLRAGLSFFPRGAVVGGIGHDDALVAPDDRLALEQLERGFAQTGGHRWIVGPGCSIHPQTPPERLVTIRETLLRQAGRTT
jgi:uroporphyrinogen decarboxylase